MANAKVTVNHEPIEYPVPTASGHLLTENDVERMAAEAEVGYPDDQITWHRGRPSLDQLVSGVSPAVTFRITQRLHDALQARAETEGVSISDIGRAALERYVKSKPRRAAGRAPLTADELGA